MPGGKRASFEEAKDGPEREESKLCCGPDLHFGL